MFNAPTRKVPDYLGNRSLAEKMAQALMDYYHQRGYKKIRVWLEPRVKESGKREYDLRSNIAFTVPQM
jgi:hypothetical protein